MVHDLVHDLLAAHGGQAVHELRVGTGEVHHVHGHLVLGVEDVHVGGAVHLLVVEAVPHVGVDEIGTLDALDVVGDGDGAAGLLAVGLADGEKVDGLVDADAAVGDLMALGAELHEIHAHLGAHEHEGDADLRGITDEGQLAVLDLLAGGQVLDHGEQVAELLGGMVVVGHRVQDRGLGVLRELDDVGMTVDARHDDVDEAADHVGGILEGLVTAELDLAGSQVLRVTTELPHGGLEGDARTGGRLLEDHAQRLVLEDLGIIPRLDALLERQGQLHHVEDLLLGEVIGVQIVLLSHLASL